MSIIEIPKTVEERAALKKEIQKHLLDHGGDAKSRTVTLKHFMQERNLPPLFIKKAMGRIGLAEKKPNKGDSKKIEKEKLKLQKRIRQTLASIEVIDHDAIHNVYDTLRKEGIKRRHIRTALFSVASKLRSKYGDEASKLLISLIRGQPEQSTGKDVKSDSKPIIQNNKNSKQSDAKVQGNKKNDQNDSKIKGKNAKNVSFTGHFESSGKQGRKIPPTPIVKKTPQSEIGPFAKKTSKTPPVAAVKSPAEKVSTPPADSQVKGNLPAVKRPATTPLAVPAKKKKADIATPANLTPKAPATPKAPIQKQMTPKQQTPKPQTPKPQTPKQQAPKQQTPKQQTPKPETPEAKSPVVNSSPQNAQASQNEGGNTVAAVAKSPKLITPKQETPVVKLPAQESPASEKQAKSVASTPTAIKVEAPAKSPVNLNGSYIAPNSTGKKNKKNSAVIEASESDAQSQQEKTPKSSILKSDNSNSGNKAAGRRVSFGAVKSPDIRTPVNSRKSVNLIDLGTPASATGIMDEECPSLVPINHGSTGKKKGKSPKFSPRVTRSAARKKVPTRLA